MWNSCRLGAFKEIPAAPVCFAGAFSAFPGQCWLMRGNTCVVLVLYHRVKSAMGYLHWCNEFVQTPRGCSVLHGWKVVAAAGEGLLGSHRVG